MQSKASNDIRILIARYFLYSNFDWVRTIRKTGEIQLFDCKMMY